MSINVNEKKAIINDSNIEIKSVYTSADVVKNNVEELPGEFPYTRGIQKDMYRGKFWTMRQYAGFSTAQESNQRYHYLLKQGVSGLSIAFDLPTQIGYDCNHPLAHGEVGKVGVSICHLQDMATLFKGIQLENISTSMTINSTAYILLAFYVALAKKQQADLTKLTGTIQNDILKEYIARGTYIYPPKPSLKIITDIFEWCKHEVPKWNTISISGYHIREAGSTAVQEVAFTLSNGKQYVQAALDKGLDINSFGKRLSFFFNAHNNLFEEIAKFRVARKIWAQIMKSFGATDPKAMMLRFHTQTGGSTLTAQQPYNNIVRTTIQSLAATLGGTQSLHTNSYDEALGLPTELAAQVALKTQQIVAYESGITQTVDPLAGSYYLENLCAEMEALIWQKIKHVDDMGGSLVAVENNYFQNEIAETAFKYQQSIESKNKIIVGVNDFIVPENETIPILKVNTAIQTEQIALLNQIKSERNALTAKTALENLDRDCKENKNIMPAVLYAVENMCTLGEIADVLRNIYGEYKSV
ncbi:MAG: methylmalonyl-CoA mutase family protein [Alphaproteobacteria bacterium]|nr:methylmalonyl-CoA mutase family protein [Alphaproteobacteria bacterium]